MSGQEAEDAKPKASSDLETNDGKQDPATKPTVTEDGQDNGLPGADNARQTKLDAHEKAPEYLKRAFKAWRKGLVEPDKVDISYGFSDRNVWSEPEEVNVVDFDVIFINFIRSANPHALSDWAAHKPEKTLRYKSLIIPGLEVIPDLLPPLIQRVLLEALLYRDLRKEEHKTNLHAHYDLEHLLKSDQSNQSYFSMGKHKLIFKKKFPWVLQVNMEHLLQKKLRWITLGGQYDWTKKEYPSGPPVPFPKDIHDLIQGLYPDMDPQAAIVNLYSAGNNLGLHRDVSEEVDRGLVSLSLGCSATFLIGTDSEAHIIKVRSGDAIYMSESARYAWHGVPQIIPETCPDYFSNWPEDNPEWKGYMRNKRINLNVRQMF